MPIFQRTVVLPHTRREGRRSVRDGACRFRLDAIRLGSNNCSMSTETKSTADSDTKALLAWIAEGTPLPPDVRKRIQERGDELTEEIRQKYGIVEIAVDLIREIRDGE